MRLRSGFLLAIGLSMGACSPAASTGVHDPAQAKHPARHMFSKVGQCVDTPQVADPSAIVGQVADVGFLRLPTDWFVELSREQRVRALLLCQAASAVQDHGFDRPDRELRQIILAHRTALPSAARDKLQDFALWTWLIGGRADPWTGVSVGKVSKRADFGAIRGLLTGADLERWDTAWRGMDLSTATGSWPSVLPSSTLKASLDSSLGKIQAPWTNALLSFFDKAEEARYEAYWRGLSPCDGEVLWIARQDLGSMMVTVSKKSMATQMPADAQTDLCTVDPLVTYGAASRVSLGGEPTFPIAHRFSAIRGGLFWSPAVELVVGPWRVKALQDTVPRLVLDPYVRHREQAERTWVALRSKALRTMPVVPASWWEASGAEARAAQVIMEARADLAALEFLMNAHESGRGAGHDADWLGSLPLLYPNRMLIDLPELDLGERIHDPTLRGRVMLTSLAISEESLEFESRGGHFGFSVPENIKWRKFVSTWLRSLDDILKKGDIKAALGLANRAVVDPAWHDAAQADRRKAGIPSKFALLSTRLKPIFDADRAIVDATLVDTLGAMDTALVDAGLMELP